MDNLNNTLFAPFGDISKYCGWFYGLEVFYLVSFVFTLFGTVIAGYNKKMERGHYIIVVFGLILKLIMYAKCRLLYSMCVGI